MKPVSPKHEINLAAVSQNMTPVSPRNRFRHMKPVSPNAKPVLPNMKSVCRNTKPAKHDTGFAETRNQYRKNMEPVSPKHRQI